MSIDERRKDFYFLQFSSLAYLSLFGIDSAGCFADCFIVRAFGYVFRVIMRKYGIFLIFI